MKQSTMHHPPYPASIPRNAIMPSLGQSIAAAAKQRGVTRAMLSHVLNGCAPTSAEFALQIQAWLAEDRGNVRLRLPMQRKHDIWRAQEQRRRCDRPMQVRCS